MSNQSDGGPAFPQAFAMSPKPDQGMSLRDHFAGCALPAVYAEAMQDARDGSGLFSDPEWRVGLALDAYTMADAMLKARNQ
ncbi:hypothetical protein [Hydrogenophaga laconesensis]|uniref:Uncharacterized protein n=1 Tax=Hydrogenophaga laconesensis TaxID=1805971 RepID=A0ABU1V9Z3_9BURK|nr:hypothetical protein [Hydrogenophaga laconesensis]MDR7094133.1 hypothetical protein [Hydrogenophaga laconesensis]